MLSIRDRTGASRQRIDKHPAYREWEDIAFSQFGLAAMSHRGGVFGLPGSAHPVAKYALVYLFVQAEFGLCCPLSMMDSLTRTLRRFGSQELQGRYLAGLTTQDMDALLQGAMFMTAKVAGSDVGAITTEAWPRDGEWRLYGTSGSAPIPMGGWRWCWPGPRAGAGTRGLSLFLMPRDLPDGTPNAIRILRLKNKMCTRSMASGEVTLDGAVGA